MGQAQGLFYHSTYRTRDGTRRLWQCEACGKCSSECRGTAFFNLKTSEAEVCRSIDAMLRGDTQTSVAQTRGHRRDTLRRWRRRAAPYARAVDEDFVTDLTVTDLELDEHWSFAGRKKAPFADSAECGEAWWHKAMARGSRLLVEQFVSPRTPEAAEMLVNRSFDRLAAGCLPRVSSDGYDAYTQPLTEQVKALTDLPATVGADEGAGGRPAQAEADSRPGASVRAGGQGAGRSPGGESGEAAGAGPQAPRAERRDARDAARADRSRLVSGRGVRLPQRRPVMNPQRNEATTQRFYSGKMLAFCNKSVYGPIHLRGVTQSANQLPEPVLRMFKIPKRSRATADWGR